MNKQGFTEKGFKRKLAVQTLFGKIYYLSEVMNVETLLFTSCNNLLMFSDFVLLSTAS